MKRNKRLLEHVGEAQVGVFDEPGAVVKRSRVGEEDNALRERIRQTNDVSTCQILPETHRHIAEIKMAEKPLQMGLRREFLVIFVEVSLQVQLSHGSNVGKNLVSDFSRAVVGVLAVLGDALQTAVSEPSNPHEQERFFYVVARMWTNLDEPHFQHGAQQDERDEAENKKRELPAEDKANDDPGADARDCLANRAEADTRRLKQRSSSA